jgi:hypothetical protein
MEPTGRAKCAPDDKLREIRGQPIRTAIVPDCAWLHPGYEIFASAGRN